MSFDFISRKFARPNVTTPKPLWEEGGDCPECGSPKTVAIAYPASSECFCHIVQHCGHCTSAVLRCSRCLAEDG